MRGEGTKRRRGYASNNENSCRGNIFIYANAEHRRGQNAPWIVARWHNGPRYATGRPAAPDGTGLESCAVVFFGKKWYRAEIAPGGVMCYRADSCAVAFFWQKMPPRRNRARYHPVPPGARWHIGAHYATAQRSTAHFVRPV